MKKFIAAGLALCMAFHVGRMRRKPVLDSIAGRFWHICRS